MKKKIEPTFARTLRRARAWLAVGTLTAGAGSCAGIEPRDEKGGDVDGIAALLVENAQERADLRQVRLWVADIHETRPATALTGGRETLDDPISLRLVREFVIALAARLNVVETELAEPVLAASSKSAIAERAAARGATHVLVGDYVRGEGTLQIAVRLCDVKSRLIVAAARGEVRLTKQERSSALGRLARTDEEPRAAPGPIVVQANPSRSMASVSPPVPADSGFAAGPSPAPAAAAAVRESHAAPLPLPKEKPIEDFESWRKRRLSELQSAPDAAAEKTKKELDAEARDRTSGLVRAMRHELADLPSPEEQDRFPWRRNPWLAELLGIPAGERTQR